MPIASPNNAEASTVEALLVTVGKVESGMAILLTDDLRMFEVPSKLLPSTQPGALLHLQLSSPPVSLITTRDESATHLQQEILNRHGRDVDGESVSKGIHLIKATHTTLTIGWPDWETLSCSGTTLSSLSALLNGRRMPITILPDETHLRLTGLDPAKSYSLQISFDSTGGRFTTQPLTVSTLPLEDLTCLRVAMVQLTREDRQAVLDLGVKEWEEDSSASPNEAPDLIVTQVTQQELMEGEYSAVLKRSIREKTIPLVTMEWVKACREIGKMQSVTAFAPPKDS